MKRQKRASPAPTPSWQMPVEESRTLCLPLLSQTKMVAFGQPCFPQHHFPLLCSHTVPLVAMPKTWNSVDTGLGFHRETKGHQRLLVSTCFEVLPSMVQDPCRACNPILSPKSNVQKRQTTWKHELSFDPGHNSKM